MSDSTISFGLVGWQQLHHLANPPHMRFDRELFGGLSGSLAKPLTVSPSKLYALCQQRGVALRQQIAVVVVLDHAG
jgi:hypothetical protein